MGKRDRDREWDAIKRLSKVFSCFFFCNNNKTNIWLICIYPLPPTSPCSKMFTINLLLIFCILCRWFILKHMRPNKSSEEWECDSRARPHIYKPPHTNHTVFKFIYTSACILFCFCSLFGGGFYCFIYYTKNTIFCHLYLLLFSCLTKRTNESHTKYDPHIKLWTELNC